VIGGSIFACATVRCIEIWPAGLEGMTSLSQNCLSSASMRSCVAMNITLEHTTENEKDVDKRKRKYVVCLAYQRV
jgi:hypothetical protein